MEKIYRVYSQKEIMESSVKYFGGDELAANVWKNKYELRDGDSIFELEPGMMHRRLAKAVGIHLSDNYGGLFPTCYSCSQTELPARSDWSEGRSSSRYIPLSAIFEIKVSYDYNACDKVIKKYPLVSSISNNKYNSDSINYNSEAAVSMTDVEFKGYIKNIHPDCFIEIAKKDSDYVSATTDDGNLERCSQLVYRCTSAHQSLEMVNIIFKNVTVTSEWRTSMQDWIVTNDYDKKPINKIFKKVHKGKKLDLSKVRTYLWDMVVEDMSNAYEYYAVYQFLLHKGLLRDKTPTSFCKQMEEWFGETSVKVTLNNINPYKNVDLAVPMMDKDDFFKFKMDERISNLSHDAYQHMKSIFDELCEDFDIENMV